MYSNRFAQLRLPFMALFTLCAISFAALPAFAQDVFNNLVNFGHPYVYDLENRIAKHWHPPARDWKDLVIDFKISKDGTLSSVKKRVSSGLPDVDRLAEAAIRQAAPYPKLPQAYTDNFASFEFYFESPRNGNHVDWPQVDLHVDNSQSDREKKIERPPVEPASTEPKSDIDFGPYMARLQRIIKSGWHPVVGLKPRKTQVYFWIDKDGKVSHVQILYASGDEAFDKAAATAIETSSFGTMPKGSPDIVSIDFTFSQSGLIGFPKSGDAWEGRLSADRFLYPQRYKRNQW